MYELIDYKTVISILIGGIITWFFAHIYYVYAGKELKKEAQELKQLVSMIFTYLEKENLEIIRDNSGNIKSLAFKTVGIGSLKIGGSSNVKFTSSKDEHE